MHLHIATIIFLIFENLSKVFAQGAPMSPCPKIFQYRFNGSEWFGILVVRNPEIGQPLNLRVTLSMRGRLATNYFGEIQLLTRGKFFSPEPVFYKIKFPYSHMPPKLLQITVNNHIVCLGAADLNFFVTRIELEHTRKFTFLPQDMSSLFLPATDDAMAVGGDHSAAEMAVFATPLQPTNIAFNNKHLPFVHKEKLPLQSLKESCGTTDERILFDVFQALKQPRLPRTTSKDYDDDSDAKSNTVQRKYVGEVRRPLIISNISDDSFDSEVKYPLIARGAWPWLAAVYVNNATSLVYRCGGTLISAHVVISAAHCFQLFDQQYSPYEVLVFLGRHNLLNWNEDDSFAAPLDDIYIHPDFNKHINSYDADIAVLILKYEASFNTFIRAACLWSGPTEPEFIEGEQGIVVGWSTGREYFPTFTSAPKILRAPIVSNNVCFQANPQYENLSSNRTFCAGIMMHQQLEVATVDSKTDNHFNMQEEIYHGPCAGDSGAGLMIFKNNRWMLRGLVSGLLPLQTNGDAISSLKCSKNQYVVYTDVAQFQDWIVSFLI